MDEAAAASITVRHNAADRRFEAEVGGLLAVADYEQRGNEMVFTHTFVPPALRGRNMAGKIVRSALEYARERRLRVIPACSYVAAFIERHPEFKPLLA